MEEAEEEEELYRGRAGGGSGGTTADKIPKLFLNHPKATPEAEFYRNSGGELPSLSPLKLRLHTAL